MTDRNKAAKSNRVKRKVDQEIRMRTVLALESIARSLYVFTLPIRDQLRAEQTPATPSEEEE